MLKIFKEIIIYKTKMSKIDKTKYMGSKEATKILGIHPNTLYNWEKSGIKK